MTEISVRRGDTLWSLARRHLGDALRWPEIWRDNRAAIEREQRRYPARRRMRGPNWIFVGTRLVIGGD